LHKGYQPVWCQAKAKAFENVLSSFQKKRVECHCKNEAQRLELSMIVLKPLSKSYRPPSFPALRAFSKKQKVPAKSSK
jgi:hypothetical protein